MTYEIEFSEKALKEWKKLDSSIKTIFKKKLNKLQSSPRVESAKLSGLTDCYKIKLRSSGFRLVYQVIDDEIVIIVIAVGKREGQAVYIDAKKRI